MFLFWGDSLPQNGTSGHLTQGSTSAPRRGKSGPVLSFIPPCSEDPPAQPAPLRAGQDRVKGTGRGDITPGVQPNEVLIGSQLRWRGSQAGCTGRFPCGLVVDRTSLTLPPGCKQTECLPLPSLFLRKFHAVVQEYALTF